MLSFSCYSHFFISSLLYHSNNIHTSFHFHSIQFRLFFSNLLICQSVPVVERRCLLLEKSLVVVSISNWVMAQQMSSLYNTDACFYWGNPSGWLFPHSIVEMRSLNNPATKIIQSLKIVLYLVWEWKLLLILILLYLWIFIFSIYLLIINDLIGFKFF